MIHLHTEASPNGFKATIALEELGLAYELHHVRLGAGEARHPDFLALNPHGRIPVIVDTETGVTLFESAAILLYLAERTGRLLPQDTKARWQAVQWLAFHAASVGPLLGQRVHFEMFEKQPLPSAIARYRRLTEEAFATMDGHLRDISYFAGTDYSIADIATFGWMHIAAVCGFDFSGFAHLSRWYDTVAARPAVQRGITLPEPATGP